MHEDRPPRWPLPLLLAFALLGLQTAALKLARSHIPLVRNPDAPDAHLVALVSHNGAYKGLLIGLICLAVFALRDLFVRERSVLLTYRAPWWAWGLQPLLFLALLAAQRWIAPLRLHEALDLLGVPGGARVALGFVLMYALTLALVAASAGLLAPLRHWARFVREHALLVLAVLVSAQAYFSALAMMPLVERFWYELLLGPTLTVASTLGSAAGLVLVPQPQPQLIGTARFAVDVDLPCLGFQGVSIFLMVTLSYFYLQRAELRFPRVFALLPACIALLLLFNAARIALLVAIGDLWSADVAVVGFHSTAGWVELFIVLGMTLYVLNHSPWFARRAAVRAPAPQQPAPAPGSAAVPADIEFWLLPQAVLVGVSFLTQLVTGTFYWAYPVHIVAAALFVWRFRARLPALHPGGPLIVPAAAGALVLALWLALIPTDPLKDQEFAAELFSAPLWVGAGWILLRIVGSSVVVPLVEELAFRGFLWHWIERRLGAAGVAPRWGAWAAWAGSSAVFGLFHGHWLAAMLAGACYGLVYRWRGRLADAVVAHATTNALLGLYIVLSGRWTYW